MGLEFCAFLCHAIMKSFCKHIKTIVKSLQIIDMVNKRPAVWACRNTLFVNLLIIETANLPIYTSSRLF